MAASLQLYSEAFKVSLPYQQALDALVGPGVPLATPLPLAAQQPAREQHVVWGGGTEQSAWPQQQQHEGRQQHAGPWQHQHHQQQQQSAWAPAPMQQQDLTSNQQQHRQAPTHPPTHPAPHQAHGWGAPHVSSPPGAVAQTATPQQQPPSHRPLGERPPPGQLPAAPHTVQAKKARPSLSLHKPPPPQQQHHHHHHQQHHPQQQQQQQPQAAKPLLSNCVLQWEEQPELHGAARPAGKPWGQHAQHAQHAQHPPQQKQPRQQHEAPSWQEQQQRGPQPTPRRGPELPHATPQRAVPAAAEPPAPHRTPPLTSAVQTDLVTPGRRGAAVPLAAVIPSPAAWVQPHGMQPPEQQQQQGQQQQLQQQQQKQQQKQPTGNAKPPPKPERSRRLLQKLEAAGCGAEGADADAPAAGGRWAWLGQDRRDAAGRRPGEGGYDPTTLFVPAQALAAMSEFNKQYWGIKARAMDLVLFVRHGSFYNLFDSDADLGMRVGLNLSGRRVPNMWKVGCTKDAFAVWAAKILALGYSVGRVEEMARPQGPGAARQKLLERRLVRIYTPGTAVDGLLADDLGDDARPFLTVVETPAPGGNALIGCCVVDVASAQVHVGAFEERSAARPGLATALCRYDPVEVCLPAHGTSTATLCALRAFCQVPDAGAGTVGNSGGGGGGAAAMSLLPPALASADAASARVALSQALPPPALRSVAELMRSLGSISEGASARSSAGGSLADAALRALALAGGQLQRCGLAEGLLSAAAFGALEVEVPQGPGRSLQPPQSAAAPPQASVPQRQHMFLDDRALGSLHVLQGPLGDRRGSLLAALDGTASPAGRRRLRQWLCRPLAVASLIEERLAVVDLFRGYATLGASLQSALRRLPDAERLLPRAARALRSLLLEAPPPPSGPAADGTRGADAEGCGSQDGWAWPEGPPGGPAPGPTVPPAVGRRKPEWRALLQQRQQQQQQQSPLPGRGGSTAAGATTAGNELPPRDPADGAWASDARTAEARAVRQLPSALSGLVEAVAVLRRHMGQLGLSGSKYPPIHKAVVQAAQAAGPVAEVCRLLEGAVWGAQGGSGGGGEAGGGGLVVAEGGLALRLAPGADEAHDAARAALSEAERRLARVTASALEAFGGGGPAAPQQPAQKRGRGAKAAATNPAASACTVVDAEAGLLSVPAAYGPRLAGSAYEFAGHASDPSCILVRCPDLARAASARSTAARATAAAAAAALRTAAEQFLGSYGPLGALVSALADLDVLAGFAAVTDPVTSPPGVAFCRPTFVTASAGGWKGGGTPPLHFDGLWHPLLMPGGATGSGSRARPAPGAPARVQPNDLRLGGDRPGALLLTGANTSGKSTLLRATCLATICAQVGCYVPAASARLAPADAIFTRMGAQDRIILGLSTFAVELSEAALAMAMSTPSSLLVLDELGRGTSTHDGCAIAAAVLDHLTAPPGAPRVLFATHYHRLTTDKEFAGRVQLAHMASELVGGDCGTQTFSSFDRRGGGNGSGSNGGGLPVLVNAFELRAGAAPRGSCGIDVAAAAGLPRSVVARARQVAAALEGADGGPKGGPGEGSGSPSEQAGQQQAGGAPSAIAAGPVWPEPSQAPPQQQQPQQQQQQQGHWASEQSGPQAVAAGGFGSAWDDYEDDQEEW